MYFINTSSTGLTDFNANYINSYIIDVNRKLTVNNINILELIIIILMLYPEIYKINQKM
jgi:hypothetical protein